MKQMLRFCSVAAVCCCVLAIAGLAAAQEARRVVERPLPENAEVRVFRAKHDIVLIESLIMGYPPSLLTLTSRDMDSGVFTVVGTPDAITQLEASIALYDKPTKNVELTFYLVEASNDEGMSRIPQQLESVIAELKRALVYKTYRTISPVIMRVRDGASAENSGVIPNNAAPPNDPATYAQPGRYQVKVSDVQLRGDEASHIVSMKALEVSLQGPVRVIATPMGDGGRSRVDHVSEPGSQITTSVDVPENQTVVVGKASMGTEDKALFVVVTAKVVD